MCLSLCLSLGCGGKPICPSWPAPSAPLSADKVCALRSRHLPVHSEIVLNGLWDFSPVWDRVDDSRNSWTKMPVPGTWSPFAQLPGPAVPAPAVSRAFYKKVISVPVEWLQSRVALRFDRISTDALVYINSRPAGGVSWPGGEIDITSFLDGKSSVVVVVEVAAALDESEAATLLYAKNDGEQIRSGSKLDAKGLIGDVFLCAKPTGTHISDVFVRTSVRQGLLVSEVTLSSPLKDSPVDAIAIVQDDQGNTVKQFSATLQSSSNDGLTLCWPWKNAKLWDLDNAKLYTLKLRLAGSEWGDEYSVRFGFREFWIAGKQFVLNGIPIRLRPASSATEMYWSSASGMQSTVDGIIGGFKKSGFNCMEIWPTNCDTRGTPSLWDWWYDRADRQGLLVIGGAPDATPFLQRWPQQKEQYRKLLDVSLRKSRNHPSVVMWTTTPNAFPSYDLHSPAWLGVAGPENRIEPKYLELSGLVKDTVGGAPVFAHNGGMNGDVYTENNYLCLTPLQEREEWLNKWAESSSLPYMAVEHGVPFFCTMLRGRNGMDAAVTEPLMTEFCAIYLGNNAYELETQEYRQAIRNHLKPDGSYRSWLEEPALLFAPGFQKLLSLFCTNTYRSWRAVGVNGGMIPWDQGYGWSLSPGAKQAKTVVAGSGEGRRGPFSSLADSRFVHFLDPAGGWIMQPAGLALCNNNGETLAWIAASGEGNQFIAKDHHFVSGATVKKQAIVLNDTRERLSYSLLWTSILAGKTVSSGSVQGPVEPAGTVKIPISFNLPAIETDRGEGCIKLECRIGKDKHFDQFPFQVYRSKPLAQPIHSVALDDPIGDTRQMLTALGWKCSAPLPAKNKLIAVGRNCLSSKKLDLNVYKSFVENGGTLVIFEQDPSWFRSLGMRVARHVTRRVFPVNDFGLDGLDMTDWNGTGTEIPENTQDDSLHKAGGRYGSPKYGWHRSNRGSVSSVCIEKPHHGPWRPLLEAEFDLCYAPLMETAYGKGHVVVCCLDLENRQSPEPVVQLAATKVLGYASGLKPEQGKPILLLGSAADMQFFSSLGVKFSRDKDPGGLVLVTSQADSSQLTNANKLLASGRTVLFLNPSNSVGGVSFCRKSGLLPYIAPPEWNFCRGISASDLHARIDYDRQIISGGAEVAAGGLIGKTKAGPGTLIVFELDPRSVPCEAVPCLRFTRWRQTRCLSQVLFNLGADFQPGVTLFRTAKDLGNPGFYSVDYVNDEEANFALADDPYRYYHW